MCGIAALFAYSRAAESADRGILDRMTERMRTRGPDGTGAWWSEDRRMGLGHRRLSIIDLSDGGAEPMCTADGSLVITFNGEIYNYRALRAELQSKGYVFKSESDTEVLLHLYRDRGEAMVHSLRGMYAFAIWDTRKKGLFLARDPFGIKPMYYSDDGHCIRVASEVKALLAGGGLDTAPAPAGHVGFFLLGYVPPPFTLYKSIKVLPAGNTMWVDSDGVSGPREYANLGALLSSGDETRLTDDDLRSELRDALLDSVRHHLVADVDVGIFLSAGLDSSTIAGLASELKDDIRTVTLGFQEQRGSSQDETILAERVARSYGTKHQTVWITRDTFRLEFDRMLDRMDQPTTDGVNTYLVSRAVAQSGLKVALSGLGGDELFGGYPSFSEIPRITLLASMLPVPQRIGAGVRALVAPLLQKMTSPKYASFFEYGRSFGGAYLLRRALYLPWELDPQVGRDIAEEGLRDLDIVGRFNESIAHVKSSRARVSVLESRWYMRGQLLRDTDWTSMSHSLEVRVPLVDWTLWKRLAPILRAGDERLNKQLLAGTPRKQLPSGIVRRAKTGFVVPTRDWLIAEHGTTHALRGLRGWARFVYRVSTPDPRISGTGIVPELFAEPGAAPTLPPRTWRREAMIRTGSRTIGYMTQAPLNPAKIRKIIVLQLQNLGDSVMFTPALRAIRARYPDAQIDMLVNAVSREVHAKSPHVNRFYFDPGPYGSEWSFRPLLPALRAIRRERYDLAIADVTEHSMRYAAVAYATGAPQRIGFDTQNRGFLFTTRIPMRLDVSVLDANLELARLLGATTEDRRPESYFDAVDNAYVSSLLGHNPGKHPLIAIHPGSNWQAKTWFAERWAVLADRLSRDYGAKVVFVGATRERLFVADIMKLTEHQHQSIVGQTTLAQLSALFSRCSLVIGLDSGPRHVAAAVNVPQVTLLSSRDLPNRWRFDWENEIVLRTDPMCSPCFRTYCSHRLCMDLIGVDTVLDAAATVLAPAQAANPASR